MRSGFGSLLKQIRQQYGLSQLALALDAEISARHYSFLETGRSNPSREMVLRICRTLDLSLRLSNELLHAAGFVPVFPERQLADTELQTVKRSLSLILKSHEPNSAFVLDRHWNIIMWNRTHELVLKRFLPDCDMEQLNAFDLVFDHKLLRPHIENWSVVAPLLLRRLKRQSQRFTRDDQLQQMITTATQELKREGHDMGFVFDYPEVVVPFQLRDGDNCLSFISTLAFFGTAVDVTVEELVVECFFPASAYTLEMVRNLQETLPMG